MTEIQGLNSKQIAPRQEGGVRAENQYAVMIINSTDYVIQKMRINSTKPEDPWTPTQSIGRTCGSTDYNACYAQKAWRELCYLNPGSTNRIEVSYQKSGQWWVTGWDTFYADPQYGGGVIQMDHG